MDVVLDDRLLVEELLVGLGAADLDWRTITPSCARP